MIILAIDPGNMESGYAVIEMPIFEIRECGKIENKELLKRITELSITGDIYDFDALAIEMVASYGMAVGKDVFETCVWSGRFIERWYSLFDAPYYYIYRKDEKMTLCHSMKANDSNIRRALIDRYAKHDLKNGKGTKKNPDVFYGVSKDMWSAIAVGVTWYEQRENNGRD